MEIKNDLLRNDDIQLKKSPNHGDEFGPGAPDTIIIHYTGGPASAAINAFTNPRINASAHLVISRNGEITQLVPFNIIAWHAGKSSYRGRTGFNKFSIGIELENSGPLTKSGNVFRSWFGASYEPTEVIEAVHRNQTYLRYWQTYTEKQIETIRDVCRVLIDTYDIKYIFGHEEVSPRRKTDPGPAFPLDKLRDQLLHGRRDEDEEEDVPESGRVLVKNLNIRSTPDAGSGKISKPLPKGTKVAILDEVNGWYKIATEIEGWVLGRYVEGDR